VPCDSRVAAPHPEVTRVDVVPELNLAHLLRMTDDVGMMQHSRYSIPDRRTGYTTDDNARALVAALHLLREGRPSELLLLAAERYMAFVVHAQDPTSGLFHNYMRYDRTFADAPGAGDCLGRALWALGCVVAEPAPAGMRLAASDAFSRALRGAQGLDSPRAQAYAILGLSRQLSAYPEAGRSNRVLRLLAGRLAERYAGTARRGWRWFEPYLTYANALLPAALLAAYEIDESPLHLEIAEEALDFLTGVVWRDGILKLVGNDGWYRAGSRRADYDEQPIDAWLMVLAYATAYRITARESYFDLAEGAFEWFLGRNAAGMPLYDHATGACYDGITPHGLNLNQGAESLLSYLLARAEIAEAKRGRETTAA